ncbi:MAG: helix-turn-helix domain-containing protein [Halodesulfurarchaeum sp.]
MTTSSTADSGPVRLTVSVGLPSGCPLDGYEGEITSSHRQLDDDSCYCQFVIQNQEGGEEAHQNVNHGESNEEACICQVVNDYGGTSLLECVEDGVLTLTVFVDRREDVYSLYEALKRHFGSVTVQSVSTKGGADISDNRRTVHMTVLTTKQRQALELAIQRGYYGNPRGIELESLADELGISRQALSNRLRSAEGNILEQLV